MKWLRSLWRAHVVAPTPASPSLASRMAVFCDKLQDCFLDSPALCQCPHHPPFGSVQEDVKTEAMIEALKDCSAGYNRYERLVHEFLYPEKEYVPPAGVALAHMILDTVATERKTQP